MTISCVILCLSHERSVSEVSGLVTQVDTSIVNFIFCSQHPPGSYEISTQINRATNHGAESFRGLYVFSHIEQDYHLFWKPKFHNMDTRARQ